MIKKGRNPRVKNFNSMQACNENSIKPKAIVVKMQFDDEKDKQAAIEKIRVKKT